MATSLFRFGAFLLDPQARELFENGQRIDLPLSTIDCLIYLIQHRDRPVGRDELASAVWGRVDVSEVSLSHSVMRLRKVLGDDGNAQRSIRTVPRLGYRWVMDVAIEAVATPEPVVLPAAIEPEPTDAVIVASPAETPASIPTPRRTRRATLLLMMLLGVVIAGAYWQFARKDAPPTPLPKSAMVLPTEVDAGPEWSWLRLGLMDLVATQLRRGDLATTPSETVVALVAARGDAAGTTDDGTPASLLIQPAASFAQGIWTVRLQARSAERTLDVEARAPDAVQAARSATDNLLIKLGHTPPTDDLGDAALALATLRQRINAALLGGQLDIARQLIRDAAPGLQADPEIALSRAKVEFYSGAYEASRQQIDALLERVPAQEMPGLRARALDTLGAIYLRQGRIDDSERAYAEVARLMEDGGDPHTLAKAYLGLGGVASQRQNLEAAASAYGRARTLLDMGNDTFGVAAVDLNLGMNALQRGQPAAALPILRDATGRFRQLGAEDALGASLVAEVDAERVLLDHAQALATSEGFAALEEQGGNRRQRWELTVSRAGALVGVGRLDAADALLARVADASDPAEDAIVRAQANGLAAEIALLRGDHAKAAELAASAMLPGLEARNRADYAAAWLARVRGLQRSGKVAEAAAEVARMRAWTDAGPRGFGRVQVLLAEAEQAGAEAHADLALQRYATAMDAATERGVPEEIVAVGQPYARALIKAGRIDAAVAVNGRIAPWANRDLRAAWSEALIYTALRQAAPAAAALERARSLAGERALSEVIVDPR